MLYTLLKPLLFGMDPELAHAVVTGLGKHFLTLPGSQRLLSWQLGFSSEKLKQNLMGLDFINPVGMAAGFDKSGTLYDFLSVAGFGFVESGTFTALAQDGNPKPRLFRYPRHFALINRMGFNNAGAEAVAALIASQKRTIPRGINIGKSKVAELDRAADDYILSLRNLYTHADYIAVNVSSPNTPGLRDLQSANFLGELLARIKTEITDLAQKANQKPKPLLVKIAPDMDLDQLDKIIAVILDLELQGIILTNTTLDHSSIPKGQDQQGGLSGKPVREMSSKMIAHVYKATSGRLLIIGVGGIFNGQDALEKIQAGASLLQIYTGYIYVGPSLPKRINAFLNRTLIDHGLEHISQLVGTQTSV